MAITSLTVTDGDNKHNGDRDNTPNNDSDNKPNSYSNNKSSSDGYGTINSDADNKRSSNMLTNLAVVAITSRTVMPIINITVVISNLTL